jgi:hypothetical protein
MGHRFSLLLQGSALQLCVSNLPDVGATFAMVTNPGQSRLILSENYVFTVKG